MDSANPPPVGAAAYIFQDWTVIVLILIAAFAVLVIAGMIWGQKKARERHRVEEAAEERAEEAGATLPPAPPPPPTDADTGLPPDEPRTRPEPETPPSPLPAPINRNVEPQALAARELAPEPIPAPAAEPEPVAKAPEPEPVRAPEPAAEALAEPTAPPPPPKSAPAPEPVAAPPEPSPPPAPDAPAANVGGALALTTIKGLGPKVAAMLAERGITRVDQLAALSPDEASTLDVQLGAFTGRMGRDRWIDQAKLLAAGDTAAYEAEFGKLG
jgi:predicted flap endonuclease-1-like 5' DNA nuclease